MVTIAVGQLQTSDHFTGYPATRALEITSSAGLSLPEVELAIWLGGRNGYRTCQIAASRDRSSQGYRCALVQLAERSHEQPWTFGALWLQRNAKQRALFYWEQAEEFHKASIGLPLRSAPLEAELLVQADRLVGGSDAVLVIDDTAMPKKGTHSVGVAAQYASATGQDRELPDTGVTTLARGEVPVNLPSAAKAAAPCLLLGATRK